LPGCKIYIIRQIRQSRSSCLLKRVGATHPSICFLLFLLHSDNVSFCIHLSCIENGMSIVDCRFTMTLSTPARHTSFASQSSSQRLTLTQPENESTYSQSQTTVGSLNKQTWTPNSDYIRYEIADLLPGPGRICVSGRIANMFDLGYLHKMPYGAKGCLKLLVRDDTGVLTVRLWYVHPPVDLLLSGLVTVWTAHVSSSDIGNISSMELSTPLCVTLFPARDRSSHIEIHQDVDTNTEYSLPLDWTDGPSQLTALRDFITGGYEIREAKILVIVNSIGSRKRGQSKPSPPEAKLTAISSTQVRRRELRRPHHRS